MSIEHLKRWHWVALSVPLGLLGAWAMLEGGPLGMQSKYATMGTEEFESRVLGRPRWFGRGSGGPPLDVRAYPLPEGKCLVTAYLPVGEPQRDERRRWVQRYRAHQFTRGGTYVPASGLQDAPQFRYAFDDEDPLARVRGRDVKPTGWQKSEPRHRDPGSAGATLAFALRKGPAYDLMVRVAPGSEKLGGALALSLNDRPLAPLTQDAEEPTRWRTTVPADAVRDGTQVLAVTRAGAAAVPVNEIELINPAYTLADFLADAKRQNPSLDYRYQRLWEPRVAYPAWTIASVIVIGGVWPSLLSLLIGAGYGRVEQEPAYDLSRFKTGAEKKKSKKQPSAAEKAKVQDLADELERRLLADAKARGDAPAGDAAAAPEPVKTLVTAPLEIAVDEKPPEQKAYAGDYYPVARGGKPGKTDDL